jgi:hypothetical protein
MPSPHGKIVVSTWVPDAIKKWALDEIGGSFCNEKEKETLRRLLTDKRMRRVWRELTRHERNSYQTTDKFFHQRDRSTTLCQKKDAKCLAENVGKDIWRCDYCGFIITKAARGVKDIEQKPLPFDKILIGFLFWSYHEPLPVLTKDEIVKLSNEIKMFSYSLGGPQLGLLRPFIEVKRHTTRDHVRAYVLQLAKACKALFDPPLYSTIATTASVALNTRVDAAFVRHVVRSHSP